MAKVFAVCNQKGGVAKTTTSVNLSAYLSLMGKKILLVDFDPQANATISLGYPVKEEEAGIYHGILGYSSPEEIIKPTALYNHHLVPANQNLAGALVELVDQPERESFLRRFINRVRHLYDYIFVDLPPSLSLLTLNGLVAADEVLIPIQCEYLSLEGLGQLLETINIINKNLGKNIKVAGAILTMYDKDRELNREVAENIRAHFPHHVFENEIPRCSALAEAPSFGRPVVLYDPKSKGASAYEKLAREILDLENS